MGRKNALRAFLILRLLSDQDASYAMRRIYHSESICNGADSGLLVSSISATGIVAIRVWVGCADMENSGGLNRERFQVSGQGGKRGTLRRVRPGSERPWSPSSLMPNVLRLASKTQYPITAPICQMLECSKCMEFPSLPVRVDNEDARSDP